MKYTVNDSCIGCGVCEATCPDVFALEDGLAKAVAESTPANDADAQEAMNGCPVGAIEQA